METSLKVLTTRNFNGVALDCYKGDDNSDFWATREQIGQLLEYLNPQDAIAKIHRRNRARLDKFSRAGQNVQTLGGTQATTVYNFRGLLEICRYSNQPAANAVIDFLWDVANDIHKHGMYMSDKLRALRLASLHREFNFAVFFLPLINGLFTDIIK